MGHLHRRFLHAYGYTDQDLNEDLTHRLMICTLLHRYSNLPWFLKEAPPPAHVTPLEDLAAFWFGYGTKL
jgi:hygromycin-B 7''-O-kinase